MSGSPQSVERSNQQLIRGNDDVVWRYAIGDLRVPGRVKPLFSKVWSVTEHGLKDRTITAVRPCPGWAPYFEEFVNGSAAHAGP
jgi:hypothetical protein